MHDCTIEGCEGYPYCIHCGMPQTPEVPFIHTPPGLSALALQQYLLDEGIDWSIYDGCE